MRTRNAFKIALGNYALVFKNLLYKLCVFTIFAVALRLLLKITLNPFIETLRPVFENLFGLVLVIVRGGDLASTRESLKDSFNSFMSFLSQNYSGIVITVIIILVAVILYRFLSGISDCTLMILVNGHMTGMAHRGYLAVMIENLKKILVYQLIDGLSSIVFTGIASFLVWAVFRLTITYAPMLTLFLTMLIIVSMISIYLTVFSQVMANVLLGDVKSLKKAIKDGLLCKREYFFKMFFAYATVVVLLVYLHASLTVFTFGVGELLLIPFASLLIVTMKTVDYFTINKKKYFVDYDNIVIPKELRENDEDLLSSIDI